MLRWFSMVSVVLFCADLGRAEELVPFPKGLPPVCGTALASVKGKALEIILNCPQSRWQVVGERVENPHYPKLTKNSEFQVQIEILRKRFSWGKPPKRWSLKS